MQFPPQFRGTFPMSGIPKTAETYGGGGVPAQGTWSTIPRFSRQLGGDHKFTRALNAPLLNEAAMMSQFGTRVPQMKRARSIVEAARAPTQIERFRPIYDISGRTTNRIGRNVTAEYVGNKVMSALSGNPLQDVKNPYMTSNTRIHQNRVVRVSKNDPAHGQKLAGHPVWNFVTKYKNLQAAMLAGDIDTFGIGLPDFDDPNDNIHPYDNGHTVAPDGVYALYSTAVANYKIRQLDQISQEGVPIYDAEDISNMFRLDGVCVSSTDESNDPIYGRASDVREYTVNIDKRHESVLNLWGKVRPSTSVWFIIKRVTPDKAPKRYILSANPENPSIYMASGFSHQRYPAAIGALGNPIYPTNPLQIEPWVGTKGKVRPSYDDLKYRDDVTNPSTEKCGVAIRLGYARKGAEQTDHNDASRSWFDSSVDRRLGLLDMYVSIKRGDGW